MVPSNPLATFKLKLVGDKLKVQLRSTSIPVSSPAPSSTVSTSASGFATAPDLPSPSIQASPAHLPKLQMPPEITVAHMNVFPQEEVPSDSNGNRLGKGGVVTSSRILEA